MRITAWRQGRPRRKAIKGRPPSWLLCDNNIYSNLPKLIRFRTKRKYSSFPSREIPCIVKPPPPPARKRFFEYALFRQRTEDRLRKRIEPNGPMFTTHTVRRNGPHQSICIYLFTEPSTVLCKITLIVHNVQSHVKYALIAYKDNKWMYKRHSYSEGSWGREPFWRRDRWVLIGERLDGRDCRSIWTKYPQSIFLYKFLIIKK